MSLHFVTGNPGAGKGLWLIRLILEELVKGNRPIVTNFPLRLLPWVNGAGHPQLGLSAYLQLKHGGNSFDCENRIKVLSDEEIPQFYRYRINKAGLLVTAEVETDAKGRVESFDTGPAVECGPILYVVDEAWKFWGSRNWQDTGEGVLFYLAQHRKFGDDVLIATQKPKQVDVQIRQVTQDFTHLVNHGKRFISMFRQPDMITALTFAEEPRPGSEPMSRAAFKIDRKGMAQCYDTAAGVGVVGKSIADLSERKKGVPFWVLCAAVVIGIGLLWKLPFVGGFLVKLGIKKNEARQEAARPGTTNKSAAFTMPTVPGLFKTPAGATSVPARSNEGASNIPLVMTGFAFIPGRGVAVTLSDGRVLNSWQGDVKRITRTNCVVDGHNVPLMVVKPPARSERVFPTFSAP